MKSDLMDVTFYERYLESVGLAVSTINSYVSALKYFLKDNPDIDEKNDYMKFVVKSMRHDMNSKQKIDDHNMFLNYYAIRKYIEWKFTDNLTLKNELLDFLKHDEQIKRLKRQKRTTKPFQIIKDKDIENIINGLTNEKHQIMFIIQWQTGVRVGDILSLKREDVNSESIIIKQTNQKIDILNLSLLTKGKIPRVITLIEPYKTIVSNYIAKTDNKNDFIFIEDDRKFKRDSFGSIIDEDKNIHSDDNFKLIRRNYWEYWNNLKQSVITAGLNPKSISTHYLRRRFARTIYDKYKDVEKLKRALNHSDVSTSLLYLQNSGQDNMEIFIEIQTGLKVNGTNIK